MLILLANHPLIINKVNEQLDRSLLTAMRQIWPLALDCLITKHERILISYKFFHINVHEADLDLPRLPHKIKNFDKA